MNAQEILEILRADSGSLDMVVSQEAVDLLLNHKCYHLLSLLNANKHNLLINIIAVRERYKWFDTLSKEIDFPYAIAKGAILSQTVYGSPFVRCSGDIDILVSRQYIPKLERVMCKHGFVQGRINNGHLVPFSRADQVTYAMTTHQVAPFICQINNRILPFVSVDINTDIMWGEYEKKTDMNYVLCHTESVEMLGSRYIKLSPEMEFVALCLHHYKDINSIYLLYMGSMKLGLFCEIRDYLFNVSMIPKVVCEICEQLNVGQYVYECLLQTYEIFECEKIKYYLNIFEKYRNVLIHDTFGLTEEERKKWDMPLLERLFTPNMNEYIWSKLSPKEKMKIEFNIRFMHNGC